MCGLRDIADTRAGVSVLPAASGMTSASVDGVLACVVFVPSAPLLVPELAGPDAVDTLEARSAVRDAGVLLARHATRWVAVGADDFIAPVRSDDFIAPVRSGDDAAAGDPLASRSIPTVGGFGRFGVDVPVSLERAGGERPPGRLPLSMLIAGWLRGQVDAESVRPVVVDPDVRPEVACELGRALGAEISADPELIGVLVVADGATALTPKAPGGGRRDSAVELQQRIVDGIGAADVDVLRGLDVAACDAEGVAGRAAWQVVAGLVGDSPMTAKVLYSDAPFGVGYVVAAWTPGDTP